MTMNLNAAAALNVSVLCALFPFAISTARDVLLQAGFPSDVTDEQQSILCRMRVEETEYGYLFSVKTGTVFTHVCVIEARP